MAQNPLDLAISAHKIARIIYFFVKITKTLSTLHHVNAILIQMFNVFKSKKIKSEKYRKEDRKMKIVVCMKQVPATSKVDIDPETGAMKRMSGETRTNPYDLFALETALAIREKTGGTVTVLTMGPPQAEEMIRGCLYHGC